MGQKVSNYYPLLTLRGSYATPDAYESGLLLPPRVESPKEDIWRASPEPGYQSAISFSRCARPSGCHRTSGRESAFACEFKDYCNQLYNVDGKCECGMAWTKRAGFALPASA